jgi:hypothetical protein
LSLWDSFTDTVRGALFFDSLPPGLARQKGISRLEIASQLAEASGPVLSILLLWLAGNIWTENCLRAVLILGVIGMNVCCWLLLFFKEVTPLRNNSPSSHVVGSARVELPMGQVVRVPQSRLVACLVLCVQFCSSFGSGMTVKYLPLFFMSEYDFTPNGIQVGNLFIQLFLFCSVLVWFNSKSFESPSKLLLWFTGFYLIAGDVVSRLDELFTPV